MKSRTLSETLKEFLGKNLDLKWNTLRAYTKAVENLIKAIGDKVISAVTQNDIEDFRVWLHSNEFKPNQRRKLGAIVSSMKNARPLFPWSIKKGYIDADPFIGVRLPKIPQKQVRVYTETELCAILGCANLIWQTIIVAAASAGLRKGEILNLRWDDVNFEDGYIIIQAHEKTRDCWPWEPKSWECRQVPLSEQLTDLFNRRKKVLPENQPYINLTDNRYAGLQQMRKSRELIPRLCYTPNENFKPFKTILRKAQIKDDGRKFHDLRSTAIINWLYAGLLPHEAQKLAGHERIETTMKYYVTCKNDLVQRARLTIGAVGFDPTTS